MILGAAALALALPVSAWAHIYKWVDERGMTVYSNVLPEKSPKNVEVVIEEKPADRTPAADAMRREQQLLDRISNLERQLQAQQYSQYIPPPPTPLNLPFQFCSGSQVSKPICESAVGRITPTTRQ